MKQSQQGNRRHGEEREKAQKVRSIEPLSQTTLALDPLRQNLALVQDFGNGVTILQTVRFVGRDQIRMNLTQ